MSASESSSRRGGGTRRSSQLTFQRRLWLVRRLVRSPATAQQLIDDARRAFDNDIYPPKAGAALHHDFDALRQLFGCTIRRMRDRRYTLVEYGELALLDLADAELETLSFLVSIFADPIIPNAIAVQTLLDRITALLPADRRAIFAKAGPHLSLEMPEKTTVPDPDLLKRLQRNIGRHYLRFRYRSTYSPEQVEEEHRVAPYHLLVRDGHTYLDAFCLAGPHENIVNKYVAYRVDRIVPGSLVVEPGRLPPIAPPRQTYQIRYRLSPQVARQRDIALWFAGSTVVFFPDGSAEIAAQTTDLWQARQILFRYREQCQVLEPPELVQMIRASVQKMQEYYS
ncbi:helix-turn-helix transcriptional regulator [Chloroflexus sp.]|uniref:helix-turn-helix transcriptional regulator n=1 Tax=Chloroflexus sp. TaxID=1904827 RepID=UPI00261A8D7F|nr:WYL domain-containing protein [uncultured Chloroflexus sp.]